MKTMKQEQTCTVVVPPNIQGLIAGVQYARVWPSGVVQLHYTDGNTESAHLTHEQMALGQDNFLSLVNAVQSMRGPTTL